jgi:hypothetical protein
MSELKQYVILGKDGRYHFSPNHPSEYEGIVGGINCEDVIVCSGYTNSYPFCYEGVTSGDVLVDSMCLLTEDTILG